MIYLDKKGIPSGLQEIIIRIKRSDEWVRISSGDTEAIRAFFDNSFPKEQMKEGMPLK